MRGKNLSPFDSIKINLTDFPIAERRSQNIQSIPLTEKYTRALGSSRREREREGKERGINLTTRIIKLSVEIT